MPARYERADVRVLGNRLRAAREAKGMTQQAVANAIGVVRTTIVAMEKGERKPREGELLQLAELYEQDVHVLLRPFDPIPPESSLAGHFRRTARADSALEHKLQACVEDVQRILRGYRELEGIYGAAVPRIHAPDYQVPGDYDQNGLSLGPSVARIAEEAAAAERNRLGLGDAPIGDLFDVLEEEEEAISIFQMELPHTVSAFYGSDDALGSCIVINRLHDDGRRHWSLAHEYAHVLTRRQFPGFKILFTYEEKRVPHSERFANAFATALLMPTASVGRRFHRIRESQGEFQSGDIMRMAHAFRVSFEAMALRLEDLQLIPIGTLERLKARGYSPQDALASRNMEPFRLSRRRLPLRFEFLVCMAAAKGLITQEEVMRYLDADRVSARKRMAELSLQPFVTEAGNQLTIEIPFIASKGA